MRCAVRVAQSLLFCIVFCISLFVLLITPLVSLNFPPRHHRSMYRHHSAKKVRLWLKTLYRVLVRVMRLKIKPNSIRIRFQSCQICVLPSPGFEPTPLMHCSTIRLQLRPAPQTTRPHPLPKKPNTEHSIGASHQISVHLVNQFQRRFLEINQPETRISYGSHVC